MLTFHFPKQNASSFTVLSAQQGLRPCDLLGARELAGERDGRREGGKDREGEGGREGE